MSAHDADTAWRDRLIAAINASGKSHRQISLESTRTPTALNALLNEGKSPSIDRLLAICRAIPVDPVWVIHGFRVGEAERAILTALADHPEARDAILKLLAARLP